MAKQKPIVVLIAGLALAAFAKGTLSRRRTPPTGPDRKSLRGLTDAERSEAIKKWFAGRKLKERTSTNEYVGAMGKQALRNELRVSERQWRIIEPKYERQIGLMLDAWAYGSCGGAKDFRWIKPTEDKGPGFPLPKTAAELTEAERNVGKLIDLLRREDTTDEELRRQIDALQHAREKARKERPKAKQELAAALTTPRQEAVFLLLGDID